MKQLTKKQLFLSERIMNVCGSEYSNKDCVMALANTLNKFKRVGKGVK